MRSIRIPALILAGLTLLCATACGTTDPVDPVVTTPAPQDTSTPADTTIQDQQTEAIIVINPDTLVLVRDGHSDYTIVTPENPTPSITTAASELQNYIAKMSGVTLPIVTDAAAPTPCELVVGYTNRAPAPADLGKEGFLIKTVEKKLFVMGSGVRGGLYGVYTLLENYFGCRFYTSEYEYIPSLPTLVLQPVEGDRQVPVFEYRDVDFVTSRKNNFQTKLKVNGVRSPAEPEQGGRVEYRGGFVHTLNNILPQDKYFAEHPEYFAMNAEGVRQSGWGVQHCLTNPDVLTITVEHVRGVLAQYPDANIISISQNDSGNEQTACRCPECSRINEEEGSEAGTLIRFVNAVASQFADDYPDLKFDTLAYRYTRSVCKTKPADNVIVRLCTIECCFSHPLGSCPDVLASAYTTKTIAEDIADWGRLTDKIYVWDYVTNFRHPVEIFPNFNTLLPNVRFFADHSVIGVYEEGNYFTDTGDFSDLRCYIMAKILWDPYMSEQQYWAHIDDFLQGVYGRGWQSIRKYIDLAQELVRDKHFSIYNHTHEELYPYTVNKQFDRPAPTELTAEVLRNYTQVDWSKYFEYYISVEDNPLVAQGVSLFDEAHAQATPEQQVRIEKIRLQLDFLRSYALHEKAKNAVTNVDKIIDTLMFSQVCRELDMTEKRTIIREISALVREQAQAEYEAFNRDLCERALKYGNFGLREGQAHVTPDNYTQLNFRNRPMDWWN